MEDRYAIANADGLDTPCLAVFPRIVEENIRLMAGMIDDVSRLRPHIKTHKTREGVDMMMAAGIRKFKCATIAEAELLGICGAPDVLLAYQPHGPKLQRLVRVVQAYPATRYACLTDNIPSAERMAAAFRAAGLSLPVYLDLNIGMGRSGIAPGTAAKELYDRCAALKGILPVGLHAYDGHHRHPDILQRKADCDAGFAAVEDLRTALESSGHQRPEVVVGGSPTFPIHALRADVECSPGTNIFWDKCYGDLCREQPFKPAAILLTRVLSLPAPGRICLDLGHKSVAAENDISRRVFFPDDPGLVPVAQSEEHLVVTAPEDHRYRPGDLLFGVPYHVCPTVALYERLAVVQDGRAEGWWRVAARDRVIGI